MSAAIDVLTSALSRAEAYRGGAADKISEHRVALARAVESLALYEVEIADIKAALETLERELGIPSEKAA